MAGVSRKTCLPCNRIESRRLFGIDALLNQRVRGWKGEEALTPESSSKTRNNNNTIDRKRAGNNNNSENDVVTDAPSITRFSQTPRKKPFA